MASEGFGVVDFIPVLLLLGTDADYPRGILEGVRHYSGTDKPWLYIQLSFEAFDPSMIDEHGIRGVIGMFGRRVQVGQFQNVRIPIVNVSNRLETHYPQVALADLEIGRMAAKYFLDRGYKSFAFFGYTTHRYSIHRLQAFGEVIRQACGAEVISYTTTTETRFLFTTAKDDPAFAWLASLPKPVAIFAANDVRGRLVCDLCRQAGLRVPEDVAVLGCDNDELMCDLTWPPLSSIDIPAQRVGFEAASMLDKMMTGEKAPSKPVLLPPLSVVTRQSSDIMALDDEDVSQALRYINDRAHESINVEDVASDLVVSRRWLEHKFRRCLGRTPADEIRRVRLERAKQLLSNTDLSMPEISRRIGLRDARRLSVLFRQEMNATPTAFRRQARIHK